ncbi:MAG: ThiF family adenylyltransferase [Bacteroides sp.]|nr:ThiF family adenylyltransferase [Bacteroides sp.]
MKDVYIDKDEIFEFLESTEDSCEGLAYEWEGEDVVHIHLRPLMHSFGHTFKCQWNKTDRESAPEVGVYSVLVKDEDDIVVEYNNGSWEQCVINFIPSRTEMFSRSKGILEVDILTEKRVMIVGLGSFGSQIAIELAKAGVSHFALFDFDRVELHNLARHTCTIKDLGRLKTNAIKDAILGKNKLAEVDLFPLDINHHKEIMDDEVSKADLIICATDNNPSRFILTHSLLKHNKVGLFGRAVTRAEGGDVFRHRPGGPCYNCLIGSAAFTPAEEITNREQLPAYVSESEANAIIQVGLSSDIEPICNLMV